MSIKTTLNLKSSQVALINDVSEKFNVSLSWLINSLVRKVFKINSFSNRFLQRVRYQERLDRVSEKWKHLPVSFELDVYEKCLDIRKVDKVSVSLVFAEAILKYLDELILELEGKKTSDNYNRNYIILGSSSNNFTQITLLWDMIEEDKLKKIQNLNHNT